MARPFDDDVLGPRSQFTRITMSNIPMMTFGVMIGLRISPIGPRTPCKGSNKPQELSCCVDGAAFSLGCGDDIGPASPFLLLPFLTLEPTVPALGLEDTPALRALIKSSP